MKFSEKLHFLMNITNTSNSALGQRVKLDPSHISRLRRGQRNAIRDEAVITVMADYFARHCMSDYQRKAIFDTLNISMKISDTNELSILIAKWLSNQKDHERNAVDGFPDGLKKLNVHPAKALEKLAESKKQVNESTEVPQDEISVYYGIEGKRKAAEYFLLQVIARNKPQTLLLYSDEATDWMMADPQFAEKWAQLMVGVLSKGNRIKVVHTVNRDLDEMLKAIHQWMPLYMTGLIEPYYYPKKRDGVFKHTRFISPGVSGVISSSVGHSMDHAPNLLIQNKKALQSYTEEFHQYLNQCKPLMRIFTAKDKGPYLETLREFEKEKSNSMIKSTSLSLLTMPENVSSSIFSRLGIKNSPLAEYQKLRIANFQKNLLSHSFSEIVPLFDIKTIHDHKVRVSFSDMMVGDTVYYTKAEYVEHLEHLAYLLMTYENYHVTLMEGILESDYLIYAKEDLGAIIAKTSAPPVALAVNETNLTAAYWDFLRDLIGDRDYRSPNNQEEAKRLEEYIQKIKALF